MKDHPILFSAPMVRALLDGSKTQTRRIVKGSEKWPTKTVRATMLESRGTAMAIDARRYSFGPEIKCPYGRIGDRLWVRETWCDVYGAGGDGKRRKQEVMYRADGETDPNVVPRWTPSIHMPHWASRITLDVTGVRVERLQDISEADALAEGLKQMAHHDLCAKPTGRMLALNEWINPPAWDRPVNAYRALWEAINGSGSWDANPWVWVVEFKKDEVPVC